MSEYIVKSTDVFGIAMNEYRGELVRCKDCKWLKHYHVSADNSDRICCDNLQGLDEDVSPDDFCSYGERKEQSE